MEFTRCPNCHEIYENTMEGLHDHYYGDNPFAKYCSEVTSNKIEADSFSGGSWFHKIIMSFKTPQIKSNALNELLKHKIELNNKLTSNGDVD